MKDRQGFVSSSSSNSFIVSFKNTSPCPTCGMELTTFIDHLPEHAWDYDSTYIKSKDVEGMIEWFENLVEWCEDDEVEEHKKLIAELKQREADGYKVYHLNISYHDSFITEVIQKDKNVTIHWGYE